MILEMLSRKGFRVSLITYPRKKAGFHWTNLHQNCRNKILLKLAKILLWKHCRSTRVTKTSRCNIPFQFSTVINRIQYNLYKLEKHNRPLWVAVQGLIRPTPYTYIYKLDTKPWLLIYVSNSRRGFSPGYKQITCFQWPLLKKYIEFVAK
jgi:hypothetical protein